MSNLSETMQNQADRQTDRQTGRHKIYRHKKTDTKKQTQKNRHKKTDTKKQTQKNRHKKTDSQADGKTDET